MSDLPFNDPEARRKRQEKLDAEYQANMAWFAAAHPRGEEQPEKPPKTGTTYFIGPEGGPIKIGFATRLSFRLNDLRLMNPTPLLVHATVEGPASIEREYHRRFRAHRLHGEWFSPAPEIMAEIEALATGKTLPAYPVEMETCGKIR